MGRQISCRSESSLNYISNNERRGCRYISSEGESLCHDHSPAHPAITAWPMRGRTLTILTNQSASWPVTRPTQKWMWRNKTGSERGLGGAGALLVSQVLSPAGRVAARRDINARRPWEAVRQSETVFTESRPIRAEGWLSLTNDSWVFSSWTGELQEDPGAVSSDQQEQNISQAVKMKMGHGFIRNAPG